LLPPFKLVDEAPEERSLKEEQVAEAEDMRVEAGQKGT
jgi:hypothetical protein